MPIYEYQDLDTGRIVELIRPADQRDEVPANLKRIEISRPAGLIGSAPDESGASYKVPRALRAIEGGRTGARDIARHFGMSVSTIKKVWNMAALLFLAVLCIFSAQAQELSPGYTFSDGQLLTASQLQQLVSQATVLPGLITDKQGIGSMHLSDLFLAYSTTSGTLYQAPFSTMISSPLLISSLPSAPAPTPTATDALAILSGGTLYQINPASLLTNAVGLGPMLTNWPAVLAVSSGDELLAYSVSSNRLATLTVSNIVDPTHWQAVAVVSNADCFAAWSASSNRLATVTGSNICAYVQTNSLSLFAQASKYPRVFNTTASGPIVNFPQVATFHGLPGTPQTVQFRLKCTTAETWANVGQEIDIANVFLANTATNAFTTWRDSSKVYAMPQGATLGAIDTYDGTGTRRTFNQNNWTMTVSAIYYP